MQKQFARRQSFARKLVKTPPKHFFCVSTDKATNPVNIMGASKKLWKNCQYILAQNTN